MFFGCFCVFLLDLVKSMTNMTSVVCGDVFYYCAHSPRGIILYYCFIEERCTQIERVIYGPLTKLLHNTAVACVFVCLFI